MFSPKRLDDFALMARAHGLELKHVPSPEPQCVDDTIEICRDGMETPFSIQIGQCGWYYVNEHTYEGTRLVSVTDHGQFRSLSIAIGRALTLATKVFHDATLN